MKAIRLLLVAFLSVTASAQSPTASVGGPTIGFVQNEQGTAIWPLLGVVGAAIPGQRLEISTAISNAVISPNQDYALAIQTDSGQAVLIKLDPASPSVLTLEEVRTNASLISVSPTGAAAALYMPASRIVQFISGLPEAPRVAWEFDASGLAGDVSSIAVSDDAALAILDIAGSANHALWVVAPNRSPTVLIEGGSPRASLVANRHDVAVSDESVRAVFLLQSIDEYPASIAAMTLPESSPPVAALSVSRDGRRIFVAQRGSENITIMDVETGTPVVVSCGCSPSGFFPLKGGSLLRLNAFSDTPTTVLDASTDEMRIVVVPPSAEALR
jgi:hypothetical protein